MPLRAAAVLAVLAGCAHEAPRAPPVDPAERQRLEFTACQSGTLPRWLDDAALAEAARLDRSTAAGAVDPNDSFRPGTLAAQPALPPPSSSGGASHQSAVLVARREFQARCELLLRSKGQGVAPPAAGP